jgi:hypothetical protein
MSNWLRIGSLLLIALAGSCASESARYFPAGALGDDAEFEEHWYSGQLAALREQPLCCGYKGSQTVVRFIWLRSFHHPVAIRLFQSGDGGWLLTTKVASGAGGYGPGHLTTNLTRKLKADEALKILSLVAPETDYWKLKSREELDPTSPDGLMTIQVDGARWIVEVLDGNSYHVVDQWSPEEGIIYEVGTRFMALSGRKFDPVY